MAGDWIKMRTDLYRDPKVCLIADVLSDGGGPLAGYVNQHCQRDMTVTRNVTRCATVGALVAVWGVMRTRGRRVGDDLLSPGASLSVLDDVADIPGFGEAMASVGWAVKTEAGVVFPSFFGEFNVDPGDEKKAKAAERQRRYRENQTAKSDVTKASRVASQSNAREEKRREEKNIQDLPPYPPGGNAGVASIAVGPEIFLYDEDPLRWRSELIRRWNRLPGVTQHNSGDLSATNVRLLMDRVRESNWLWQAAMAKFPLWFGSGWRPTLGWFLKPDNVANILDGNYERPVKQEAAKPEPRILEPITYTEAELEGVGDDVR